MDAVGNGGLGGRYPGWSMDTLQNGCLLGGRFHGWLMWIGRDVGGRYHGWPVDALRNHCDWIRLDWTGPLQHKP